MQIKKIELENFRGFKKQTIELLPNINVFVGVNGAGKSTILDAIAISLSWLINRIQKRNSKGMYIEEESIRNDADFSSLVLTILESSNHYQWKNIEDKLGYPSKEESLFLELDSLAYQYQSKYKENNTLPVIAYYPVNRIAKGISISTTFLQRHNSTLDVYDNSLGAKANFQAFFNWFREQDDIINEQYSSRNKWMIKNKPWIQRRLKRILTLLENRNQNNRFLRMLEDNFLLEEPRFLFHQLIETIEKYSIDGDKYITHEIEYVLHRMSRLFDRVDDEIVEINDFILKDMTKILEQIFYLNEKISVKELKTNENILQFIWEVFLFATQVTFWRLSQKGREDLESIFRYSNPIRKRHELLHIENFIAQIKSILEKDDKRLKDALSKQGRELKIVAKTIEKFIPEYQNLRVSRIPRPHMLVDKNGKTLKLNQLSDGEKNMIAMIGDISRRLSMANPSMENPLKGDAVIMIDEIDLHLHPRWQRLIISKLTEVFPNCQFIVTTHSPQILSHLKAEHIFLLTQDEENISVSKPTESYGKSSDRQLEDILGVESRPLIIKDKLHQLYQFIQEKKLIEAKELMSELEEKIEGREPELVKADVLIKRKEILGK